MSGSFSPPLFVEEEADRKDSDSAENHERAENLACRDVQERSVLVNLRSVDAEPVADVRVRLAEIFDEEPHCSVSDCVETADKSVERLLLVDEPYNAEQENSLEKGLVELARVAREDYKPARRLHSDFFHEGRNPFDV